MEYKIITRSKILREITEELMNSYIAQLGLENSKMYLLIDISKKGSRGHDGLTHVLPNLKSCVIAIHPQEWQRFGLTLAHEMVHFKQYAKGHLRKDGDIFHWRGKQYSADMPYLDMPWEVEAYSKQELMFRKAALEN